LCYFKSEPHQRGIALFAPDYWLEHPRQADPTGLVYHARLRRIVVASMSLYYKALQINEVTQSSFLQSVLLKNRSPDLSSLAARHT
jgi:hypothetical protein